MSGKIEELTDANFDEKIKEGKVLVDFHAVWCGPCKMIAPLLDEIADEYAGQITIYKVNVDECQETATKCGISSMPTMQLYQDGVLKAQQVGAVPKPKLVEFMQLT